MRAFDPRRVAELECAMWAAYYRREWWRLLRAAIALVRHAFGLPWPAALLGAWWLLDANRRWAPAHNDADGARRAMQRFYALVAARHRESFDATRAAALDVEWWRVHRAEKLRPDADRVLADAVGALYAHVYRVVPHDVLPAAEQRVLAMRLSDAWVADGCRHASPLLEAERAALVRSYAALLAAVHV